MLTSLRMSSSSVKSSSSSSSGIDFGDVLDAVTGKFFGMFRNEGTGIGMADVILWNTQRDDFRSVSRICARAVATHFYCFCTK
jgi:hypothetical protein